MRDTQLVLVEGMPGSGKSTAAAALERRLAAAGARVVQVQEVPGERGTSAGMEHPLHVGGALFPVGLVTGEVLFTRYTPEAFVEESLRRWEALVAAALESGVVYVVESYPHQSGARVLLQMDASEAVIREHAARVEEAIAPLRPVLVYLDRRDSVADLRATAAQRGPAWAAYLEELVGHCPYAERRGLTGMDAVDAVIGEYKALLDSLVEASRLPTLVLHDCAGRWDACYRRVDEFLDILR